MKDKFVRSLKEIFDNIDKKNAKITVLGVGSELRADDGAGLLIAENLIKMCGKDKCGVNAKLQVIYGETAPENFTGEIRRFAPTHLILIDAAEMGLEPGTVKVIKKEDVKGVTFSTHLLPLSVMIDYLANSFKFETIVVGIEPKDMTFGHAISEEIKMTVDMVSEIVFDLAKELV